jgi:hypothetical protein
MNDADRYRLLGSYATPAFSYGDVVTCAVRGDLVLCGLSSAPIPWPIGKRPGKGARARSLAIYGALADAVRRESGQAVAHWWGVAAQTVSAWRKALDVPETNEGTHALRSAQGHEAPATAGRARRWSGPTIPLPTRAAGPRSRRRGEEEAPARRRGALARSPPREEGQPGGAGEAERRPQGPWHGLPSEGRQAVDGGRGRAGQDVAAGGGGAKDGQACPRSTRAGAC